MMDENREPAFWPWFISLSGCCGIVGYFVVQRDHVAAVSVIALTLSALSGYCMMASRLLRLYGGLVVSALLTSTVGLFCRPALAAWFGTSGSVLIILVTGIVVALAITVGLRRLVVRFCPERPSLEALNRWAGFGMGAVQGVILCLLALGGLLVLDPIAKDRLASDAQGSDHKIARVLATKVVESAGHTRDSAIGPTVEQYNLLRQVAPLKELCNELRTLRNPLTRAPSKTERIVDQHLSER